MNDEEIYFLINIPKCENGIIPDHINYDFNKHIVFLL